MMKTIVLATGLACGATLAGGAFAADKVTLQLKWVPQAQFAGYIAAVDQGFYKQQGLDVQLIEGGTDIVPQTVLAQNKADFTLTFRRLCQAAADPKADAAVGELFSNPAAYDAWAGTWRSRLAEHGAVSVQERVAVMRTANPAVIPRNHLVEDAISAAVTKGDFAPFEDLIAVLANPYEDVLVTRARYAEPPRPDQVVRETFCGT